MRAYEYRHTIAFEETNLVGNVYYINHLRWQGRVREMFLRDYAPQVIDELQRGLLLVTMRCSCEYLQELYVFDNVVIRMTAGEIAQSRFSMKFEYWRQSGETDELVARGEQQIACMRRENGEMIATTIPLPLREAIDAYT